MSNRNRPTIWIDTETGGFSPYKQDLLTIALVLAVPGGTLDSKAAVGMVSRDPDEYRVNESAMQVNGLNLEDLHQNGRFVHVIDAEMSAFVLECLGKYPDLRLGGQNVQFDFDFIRVQLPKLWRVFKDHGLHKRGGHVDTRHMAATMMEAGYIQPESASLENLCAWYGIRPGGHQALADAEATAQVYQRMMDDLEVRRAGEQLFVVQVSPPAGSGAPFLLRLPFIPTKGWTFDAPDGGAYTVYADPLFTTRPDGTLEKIIIRAH